MVILRFGRIPSQVFALWLINPEWFFIHWESLKYFLIGQLITAPYEVNLEHKITDNGITTTISILDLREQWTTVNPVQLILLGLDFCYIHRLTR